MDDSLGDRGRKAKRDAQAKARDLRAQGWSYNAIAAELGVAKSSVSVWCQDVILTEAQRSALQLPVEAARLKRAESVRAGRIRRTEAIHAASAADIGELTDRELFLIGVALYWAEGSKEKPWRPGEAVSFINSDPDVIRTFIAWLRSIGVRAEDLVYRVTIHEDADATRATAYWAAIVGCDPSEFQQPNLKRHNPKTVRKNRGEAYFGCLIIKVRRSTDFNRRIAGWWKGIAQALPR